MRDMDMLHGSLWKKILIFTLPIALGSMLQQLFNTADTAVVGMFGDADAIAAVGTNSEIVGFIVTVSSGLAVGANVLAARRLGQGRSDDLPSAAQTALAFALIVGAVFFAVGQFIAQPVLRLIHVPENIITDARRYLQIYFWGYPFLLLYDFGAALLRARGDSRHPFIALVCAGTVNIALNLCFTAIFRLGVAGVALSTSISNALSAFLVLRRLAKDELFRLRLKPLKMRGNFVTAVVRIGVPAAIQGAVLCLANIFLQSAVNQFGETVIAGNTIALNFEYFSYYIVTAFSQTATTFVSQNFAAGQRDRCRTVFRQCFWFSVFFSAVFIAVMWLLRRPIVSLFSSDEAVMKCAFTRMICVFVLGWLCTFFEVPAAVLRGTGYSVYPAIAAVVGICVVRIIWVFFIFPLNKTIEMLYIVFPVSWMVTSLLMAAGLIVLRPMREKPLR